MSKAQLQPPITPNICISRQQLPLSPTDIVVGDAWIVQLHIVNDGSGPATVSVYDKQTPTPGALVPAISLGKGGLISEVAPLGLGTYMPGGITWSASAAGVWGYLVAIDLSDGYRWAGQ